MSHRLDWKNLLSDKRQPPLASSKSPDSKQSPSKSQESRTAFERDYDRIIFSTPFRRLAGKTQVHPFAKIDHVHNRLTHTLEVASVGRSLAYAAGRMLKTKNEMPDGFSGEDLSCIVQAACLAHDIGNPPFGHAGEYAVREWVKANGDTVFNGEAAGILSGVARDWRYFEGNAQAFRMVARADNRPQCYFLLTYASLGAMLKYPWLSTDDRVLKKEKFGAFSSESEIFRDVVETLGLKSTSGDIARHPLSYLSEAADDICYRIGVLEDAAEMRILSEDKVKETFLKISKSDPQRPISALRAKAISRLVDEAIRVFEEGYDEIMSGQRDVLRDLKSDFSPDLKEGLDEIRQCYESIFSHRPKVAAELGAYNTLGRILGRYADAVKELTSKGGFGKLSFVERRCLELAWGSDYVRENEQKDYAWWLGRVMDFVVGMTDSFALQVSREIDGV